jgi:hypothetical protein
MKELLRTARRVNTSAHRVNVCASRRDARATIAHALTKSVNEKSGLSFNVKPGLKIAA